MPYQYRTLSPDEKAQLVEARRRRGFPLHQPPHPFRESGGYLITAANFEHAAIMLSPARRSGFEEVLLRGFQEIHAQVAGWVILPNHYHLLAAVDSLDLVSRLLKQIHGSTSFQWNQQDGLTGKRRVWYRFVDRRMRDEAQWNRALNYIHFNPVKHGLVIHSYDWQWSSLSWYEAQKGNEWLQELGKGYEPPDDFGEGWDL